MKAVTHPIQKAGALLTGILVTAAVLGMSAPAEPGHEGQGRQMSRSQQKRMAKAQRKAAGHQPATAASEIRQDETPEATPLMADVTRDGVTGWTTVHLTAFAGQNVTLEVFDITGKKLLHREHQAQSQEDFYPLNFSHAADGVYFIVASADGRQTVLKLIKQSIS